jgi:[ribosomal protein S5]-alanine N-acetyltransferase
MTVVRTERLLLRRFEDADLEPWAARIYSDPKVMRYLPAGPPPRERARASYAAVTDHWDRLGYGMWAAVEAATGEFIGYCGLRHLPDVGEVEVAYGLARDRWGRGLATEAATAAVADGFERVGLHRIVAYAVPANTASRRVIEKLGMTLEGETHLFDLDLVRYALAAGDWKPRPP